MDKLKVKTRSARNRIAESASRGGGSASLAPGHGANEPDDNASTMAVNEGFLGQGTTAARDFAMPANQSVYQPVIEPPTSLQSSVDAGQPVPAPSSRSRDGNRAQPSARYVLN